MPARSLVARSTSHESSFSKPRKNRRWRWFRRILLTVTLFFLLLVGALIVLIVYFPLPSNVNAFVPTPSSRIMDRSGHLLYEVVGPGGRRATVPLSQIPLYLRQATIAAEDNTFYQNKGVDPRAVVRSIFLNLNLGRAEYGGSTITQQLVRTIFLSPEERDEHTLSRKLHEASLALQLSFRLSKDQILALYLNNVYYGNMAYGVESAAEGYFGRPVATLDLAQCALLAGLPKGPSLYNPLLDPDAARSRRHAVLQAMLLNV